MKDFPITALDLPQLTLGNGANADHDYKWAPALPPGLTPNHDDPASLSVSGVPTAASDEETYTLTVSDRDGDPASVSVKITVEEDMVPRFAPWDEAAQLYLKDASITPFRLPVLTPGNGDHTYAWDKALPAGLTFDDGDPANLTVSGTPTAVSPQTPYTLTVTDMDEDAVTLVVRIEVTDDQTRAVTTAGLVVTKSRVDVPENGDAEFGLRLSTAPTHDVTVALERSSEGDEDLRIREGASLTFTAATWETAQTVTLEAQDDADKVHGTATFLATSTSDDPNYDGRTVEVEATEVDDDAPRPPPPPVPVALPLAFAGSVNDLVYTEGKEIPGLVLPQANGGTAPLAYELAPLPSGLVFDGDPAIRRLAGTPDRPGSTPLSYTVTDAAGDAATLAFRIVVEEDLAPLFDPGMVADLKPQNYVAGNAVHLRLPLLTLGNGTNGDHSYEWSGKNGQTLALPVGLSLEGGPASLAITGTPTERMVSTEYTLTVTDRDGDATRLTLHIAVLEITEKPPGSEVTFDEETGEIMLRNVRFALADGPERTWDAARIKLPAGHMVTGLALRVANLADDEAMPPDPGTLFGGVALVISPTGGLAGRTASVCLSTDGLPQGKAPRLYHEEPASGVWKRVDTEMRGDAGLVCGDVSSFSRFRAGYEAESLMQVRERALEHMLAAFGRTVATDAVSVLSGRMVDVSQGGTGSRFTLAGRTPGSRGTVPGHDGMTIRTGSDRATAARNDGDWLGTGRGEPDLWADRTGSVTAISDRELLTGTSFQLALGEENGGAGGHATLWGKGRTAGFRGISAEGFALDGDVVSGWLGIDWRRSDLLLGLALSHSQGEMDYEDLDAINRDFSAQVKADLTGVYPYARLSLDDDLDVWGIAGVGAGGLTLADGFGGNETDIDMGMAAAGARRALGSWSLRDIDFAVKGDALSVMMRSDPRGLASPDSGDDLPEVNVSAQRVRLALEGGHTRTLESGGLVQSTLELGARYDRGGAETGAGVDLAGAVRYEDLSRGLTVEGRGRLLLAHEAEGFEEWGVGGTIRLSPGASGLGYSFSMEPSWGAAASGAGRLWNDRVTTGADTAARRRRLAAEFGYGLGVFGGQGVLTPHVAASLADGDGQDYRVGARLRLGLDLRVDVGVHHLEGGDGEAELGIGLQLSSGF
ncbi:MAG: Ig domain-containing protein [Acidobacteria bacterium]|nr:Ig domain-containing protein [Acidobacteriota bacterium]